MLTRLTPKRSAEGLLRGQAIARLQIMGGDVLLDAIDHDIAEPAAFDKLEHGERLLGRLGCRKIVYIFLALGSTAY